MRRVFTKIAFPCAALMLSVVPRLASAQECQIDTDCEKGLSCQETASGACPAIACAPDTECPPCDVQTIKACLLAPCDPNGAADQCGDDKVCHTDTFQNCAGAEPVCGPDMDCVDVKPEPADCTTETQSTCTYKAWLPCETASDCGAGYNCVLQPAPSCGCSGSSGMGTGGSSGDPGSAPTPTPAKDGGAAPDQPPPAQDLPVETCDCPESTESDVKWCQPQEIQCETGNDCPEHWDCIVSSGGTDVACSRSSDGSEVCPDQPAAEAPDKKLCYPSYIGVGGAADSGGDTTSAPQDGVNGSDSKGESESPLSPGLPFGHSDNSSSGNAIDDDVATTGTTGASSNDSSGGCSVVSPGASSGASLAWLAVGLVALARRRKS